VWIWQTGGQLLQRIEAHPAPVWGVAFSPEGNQVASASGDGTAKIWSATGQLSQTLRGHDASVWALAFSPDGRQIATASMDNTLRLWSREGKLRHILQGHRGPVWDVDFCSNQTLASVSSDASAKLWGVAGQLLRTFASDATLLGVSCRGGFVAASGKNNLVKIWAQNGAFRRILAGHRALIRDVAFTQNGLKLVSGSDDGAVKMWSRNAFLVRPLYGQWNNDRDTLWSVTVSPDGRLLASIGGDRVQIYDRQGNFLHKLSHRQYNYRNAVFSADSRFLIATNDQGESPVWELARLSSQSLAPLRFLPAPKGLKMALAASPDGKTLAVGGDLQEIWLTDLKTQAVTRIPDLPDRIWALSFSADGEVLASASEDGTAKLWTRQGKLLTTLNHGGAVWGAAISPQAPIVATVSREGTLKLWDFQGNLLRTIPGQSNGLTRVAFSPDGQTLATGGIDSAIRLWSLDGKLLKVLPGHRGSVISLAFSPEGKLLLSGGDGGVAMLWDLAKIQQTNDESYACQWLADYLRHSEEATPDDRQLCPP